MEKTSETFLTMVRRLVIAFLIILFVAFAGVLSDSNLHRSVKGTAPLPSSQLESQVGAQNAGNVGIYTREIPVFTSQASSKSSAIFPDFGFAANFLNYCNFSFVGSIDLEWAPAVGSTYIPLNIANYATADSSCHRLQVGGYYPNLRSTMTRTAGSVSAWYTASAAPIPYYASALGSNGATSPVSCDINVTLSAPNSATTWLNVEPINIAGDVVNICNFTISFAAAPSTGTVSIGWAGSNACSSLVTTFEINTTSATPQTLIFPAPQNLRSSTPASGAQYPCIVNNSGVALYISLNAAAVNGL